MFDRKADEAGVDSAHFQRFGFIVSHAHVGRDIDVKPGLTAMGPCMRLRAVSVATKVLLAW
jgi:hypothetical protein